jgi:hypothetical protein
MRLTRRALLLVAMVVVGMVWSGSALAARLDSLPFMLDSAHFRVHYQSNTATTSAITETKAGDLAAIAERVYAAELDLGYPAPPSDGVLGGDGRVDIYVTSSGPGVLGETYVDTAASPTTAYILLDAGSVLSRATIAHEFFHVIQLGIWSPTQSTDTWLFEGSAEWMGYKVDQYNTEGGLDIGNWDMSLNCRDAIDTNQCDLFDDYKNLGYSRWPFFEYLTERWGSSFVRDVLTQGALGPGSATSALVGAIAAKGEKFPDVFVDWTVANLTGEYSAPALHGLPPATYSSMFTGTETSKEPTTQRVALNHLAARYLEFKRGDGSDSACYKATLNVTVTIPSGIAARPYFYWPALGATPVPLTIVGNTATLAGQDWDTCAWPYGGYLVLQNPSLATDAADFKVDASIVVDKTQPASATAPPPPVTVWGPVVPAPATDPPPTLAIHAPEVLRVASRTRLLRFVVYASGPGKLQATLGSASLGTPTLRTGNNDVRFVLPKTVFSSLRSTKGANVLSLKSLSSQGAAGATFTRHVAIQKPAKKKPKKPSR